MLMPQSVMIIDDNTEMLETMSMMLRHMGIRHVVSASSVAKASQLLADAEKPAEIIICDWNMPEQTGLDFLAKLRKDGNLIPFIMVTARNDTGSVIEASNKGVDLYICKPFSLDELKRKIHWVANGPHRATEKVLFSDS